MTAPNGPAAQPTEVIPLTAEVGIDMSEPAQPKVVLRLKNAGIAAEFRIDATRAADFGLQVGQGLVMAAQQALTQAGPKLITPNGAGGGLFLPNPGAPLPPPNGAGR